jgi:hypothetical protein
MCADKPEEYTAAVTQPDLTAQQDAIARAPSSRPAFVQLDMPDAPRNTVQEA